MKKNVIGPCAIVLAVVLVLAGCVSTGDASGSLLETTASGTEEAGGRPVAAAPAPQAPAPAAVTGTAGAIIMEEDFTDPFSPAYELWGAADFNRVEAYEGKLEFEGSAGNEGFGVFFKQQFDLARQPISISLKLERNATNHGSEICLWFVNEYLIKGSPWDEGNFIRVKTDSTGQTIEIQETSPEQRGHGVTLAKITQQFEMGVPFDLELRLTPTSATVLVNGKEVRTVAHNLPSTTGYLHIHDWNSLGAEVDWISDLKVRAIE